MPKKRSAVEQRREQITAQVNRLRRQLASKTRKDYTSDYRYETWLKQSYALIDELLGELSVLDEPGEYDELPVAVVADELGLGLNEIRRLIKLSDIDATGRRAHERVSRGELERLSEMKPDAILRHSRQSVEAIFAEAVSQIRAGNLESAGRSYRRLKARQSCVGNHALAAEFLIKLAEGRYEECERLVEFILGEKLHDSIIIGAYLAEVMGGVCFKSQRAREETLCLLVPLLGDEAKAVAHVRQLADDLQLTAMCVTTIVLEGIDDFMRNTLSAGRKEELCGIIKDRVFSVLYAKASMSASLTSSLFILCVRQRIPCYWKPAELIDDMQEG